MAAYIYATKPFAVRSSRTAHSFSFYYLTLRIVQSLCTLHLSDPDPESFPLPLLAPPEAKVRVIALAAGGTALKERKAIAAREYIQVLLV